jgi:hypothetical protein
MPGAASLGLVKVRPGATPRVVDGPVWEPSKQLLAEISAAPHLLRDKQLTPLRPPEVQVRYDWFCMDEHCRGHSHASCDWEVGAAALNWMSRYPDVRPELLRKFGDQMLDDRKDTYFFVGNQDAGPGTFMVLGVFYPPVSDQA